MANKTFADVKKKAEKDPQFLAQLIVSPKKALSDANIELPKSADINKLELFVRMSQEQIRVAGRIVGIKPRTADWGIGATCCNGRLIMPGGGIAHRGDIR